MVPGPWYPGNRHGPAHPAASVRVVRCHLSVELSVSRDDVVLQRPEDLQLPGFPYFHDASSATACLLRRIVYRVPARTPRSRSTSSTSCTPERGRHDRARPALVRGPRVPAARAGLPAAVPPRRHADQRDPRVGPRRPGLPRRDAADELQAAPSDAGAAGKDVADDSLGHAVSVTIDRLEPTSEEDLVMIDPWPGVAARVTAARCRRRSRLRTAIALPRPRLLLGRLVLRARAGRRLKTCR